MTEQSNRIALEDNSDSLLPTDASKMSEGQDKPDTSEMPEGQDTAEAATSDAQSSGGQPRPCPPLAHH